jgi:hypothetical protein
MMTGEWDEHHGALTEPKPYGGPESYQRIAEFVADCATVADWGCGGGGLRPYIQPPERYFGIDGSASPYADLVADLRNLLVTSDAVVLRHVLEHNDEWERVLANAVDSAQRKLAIVLFTPLRDETTVLLREPHHGDVPVIAFAVRDIAAHTLGWEVEAWDTIDSPGTYYGEETLLFLERP